MRSEVSVSKWRHMQWRHRWRLRLSLSCFALHRTSLPTTLVYTNFTYLLTRSIRLALQCFDSVGLLLLGPFMTGCNCRYRLLRKKSGQVFIVQLLSARDAATNSLHCSLSSAMSHSVILYLSSWCFPQLGDTGSSKVFFSSLPISSMVLLLIFCHLAATPNPV